MKRSSSKKARASVLGVEVAALPAPVGPGAGQPVEHLRALRSPPSRSPWRQPGERRFVGRAPPQPRRHAVLAAPALRRAGTPALRKYFCASTSHATCDHAAGTSTSSWRNTTEPSGLRISLRRRAEFDARRKGTGRRSVNSRGMRMTGASLLLPDAGRSPAAAARAHVPGATVPYPRRCETALLARPSLTTYDHERDQPTVLYSVARSLASRNYAWCAVAMLAQRTTLDVACAIGAG